MPKDEGAEPRESSEERHSPAAITLRFLMELGGMKQKTLAAVSGVDRTSISRYLSGERPISNKDRVRLLTAVGITPGTWEELVAGVSRTLRDRERSKARSRADEEYTEGAGKPSEIRELPPPEAHQILAPETADRVVGQIVKIFEDGLYRLSGLFVDPRR